MQTLQRPIHHATHPEDRKPQRFHVASEVLGRVVFATELATLPLEDLRTLYHEVYCVRQSMFHASEGLQEQLGRDRFDDEESKQEIESKLRRLSRKVCIYNTFYKLIKREVNLRTSLNQVARVNVIIQAKQVGLNDAQVNALLDPDNAIHKIFAISDYAASPARRKAICVADRLQSLREQLVMTELISLLSKEFEAPELAEIKAEARAKAEQLIDWRQVEAILNEHLPDENVILQL